MNRRPLFAVLVAGALLLAGCAGGVPSSPTGPTATSAGATATATDPTTPPADPTTSPRGTGGPTTAGTGTVDFYVSDEENAIGDFEHVNVTVTKVGFERAGSDGGGWIEHDVDGVTVDLTGLQGPRSAHVDSYDLPEGDYTKVFLHVGEVDATLETGEEVRVKLPSEKLQLTTDFSLENGSAVEFVFDVTVKRAGNSGKYILRPVITESGTDVPIEPADEADGQDSDEEGDGSDGADGEEGDGKASDEAEESDDESGESDHTLEAAFEGNVSAGENATLVVTRNGSVVENATVAVDDERVGTTDANGELTVAIPEADTVTVVVESDGDVVELEYEFE